MDAYHLPAMLLSGTLTNKTDQATEAVQNLSRAAKLYPGEYQVHFQLALAYHRSGQKGLAQKHFERMQE